MFVNLKIYKSNTCVSLDLSTLVENGMYVWWVRIYVLHHVIPLILYFTIKSTRIININILGYVLTLNSLNYYVI